MKINQYFDSDNLGEVVKSGLGWGLILYGEEEEKVMAASSDPIISKLWSVSCSLNSFGWDWLWLIFKKWLFLHGKKGA